MAEKEYIERAALKGSLCDVCNDEYSDTPCEPDDCFIIRVINEQPAADVVEVVRCEHCQYSHSLEDPFNNKTVYYCDVHQHQVRQDGFCSSGDKGVGNNG